MRQRTNRCEIGPGLMMARDQWASGRDLRPRARDVDGSQCRRPPVRVRKRIGPLDAPIDAQRRERMAWVKAAKRRRRRVALTRAIAPAEWSIGASAVAHNGQGDLGRSVGPTVWRSTLLLLL